MPRRPQISPLFPYTTLFRSINSIKLEQTMAEHVGRGSLTGRWKPRQGACPNIRGGIMIERDVPAGAQLWLMGSSRNVALDQDRKSTRLNSSHTVISYAVFCL